MKVRLVGTEVFHADREKDRRTDMTKLIVAFRSSANASNKALQLIFKGGVSIKIIRENNTHITRDKDISR